jgi:hypothetical protein
MQKQSTASTKRKTTKATPRYKILATGKHAGVTKIELAGKIDKHTNECVLDKKTGLMWSRAVAAGLGPNPDGQLPWSPNNSGESIFAFAEAANKARLGGHDDWRVPTAPELYSLCEFTETSARPNITAFPNWPINDWVWSGTTRPNVTTYAVSVYFSSGSVSISGKEVAYYCALTRG